MSSPAPTKLSSRRLVWLVHLSGWACCLIGAVALLGWHMRASLLVKIHSDFAPLQYNAAWCFLLAGLGLLALEKHRFIVARLCGMVVSFIGVLTVMEYGVGIDLGIDRLAMSATFLQETLYPGRMGTMAAVAFLLTGVALLAGKTVLLNRFGKFLINLFGLMIVTFGLVIFLGYLIQMVSPLGLGSSTGVAMHAGMGFAVLGAGLVLWVRKEEHNGMQQGVLNWTLFLVLLGMVIGNLGVAWTLHNLEETFMRELIHHRTGSVSRHIGDRILPSLGSLIRMAKRWERQGRTEQSRWEQDAALYIKHDPLYQAIMWIDSSSAIRWRIVKEGSIPSIGHHVGMEELGKALLRKAGQEQSIWISHPITLAEGEVGIFVYIPLLVKDRPDGFLVAAFGLQQTLTGLLEREFKEEGYAVFISDGTRTILKPPFTTSDLSDRWAESVDIQLYNVTWTVGVKPTRKLQNQVFTGIPNAALTIGLLLTALVIGLIYFIKETRGHERELMQKNKDLEHLMFERARIQDDLDKINQQHRLILESMAEGVYGVDMKGHTTFLNPAALRMLGMSLHELTGQSQHAMIHHSKPDGTPYPREDCPVYKAYTEGISHRCDTEVFWRKDGTSFPIEYMSVPIHNGQNRIVGAVVTFLDISKRKQAEAEVSRKNAELETLLYVTSHDLREPLRGIESFASLLKSRYAANLDDKGKDFLNRIVGGTQRMNALLNDILTLSRVRRLKKADEKVNGHEVVRGVLESLSHRIEETGATVQVVGELPEVLVERTWVNQALYNLVGNALKFTKNGEAPDIEIGSYSGNGQGRTKVGFVVRDRGPGVADEQADRIFQLFHRAVGREVEGTGAGLAIVRQIAERHGGWAWVQSRPGGGSEFFVTFESSRGRSTYESN